MPDELQTFLNVWDTEAGKTIAMLRALPPGQYDFRPDPAARSLGELAWHLAELDAYVTFGIEQGEFKLGAKPPGIERPKTIEALAPGYERIHADAVVRVGKFGDLNRKMKHFTGDERTIRELLWGSILFHHIHHRGQLSVLTRLAGGVAPGLYGPNREEMAALRARMQAS